MIFLHDSYSLIQFSHEIFMNHCFYIGFLQFTFYMECLHFIFYELFTWFIFQDSIFTSFLQVISHNTCAIHFPTLFYMMNISCDFFLHFIANFLMYTISSVSWFCHDPLSLWFLQKTFLHVIFFSTFEFYVIYFNVFFLKSLATLFFWENLFLHAFFFWHDHFLSMQLFHIYFTCNFCTWLIYFHSLLFHLLGMWLHISHAHPLLK